MNIGPALPGPSGRVGSSGPGRWVHRVGALECVSLLYIPNRHQSPFEDLFVGFTLGLGSGSSTPSVDWLAGLPCRQLHRLWGFDTSRRQPEYSEGLDGSEYLFAVR